MRTLYYSMKICLDAGAIGMATRATTTAAISAASKAGTRRGSCGMSKFDVSQQTNLTLDKKEAFAFTALHRAS